MLVSSNKFAAQRVVRDARRTHGVPATPTLLVAKNGGVLDGAPLLGIGSARHPDRHGRVTVAATAPNFLVEAVDRGGHAGMDHSANVALVNTKPEGASPRRRRRRTSGRRRPTTPAGSRACRRRAHRHGRPPSGQIPPVGVELRSCRPTPSWSCTRSPAAEGGGALRLLGRGAIRWGRAAQTGSGSQCVGMSNLRTGRCRFRRTVRRSAAGSVGRGSRSAVQHEAVLPLALGRPLAVRQIREATTWNSGRKLRPQVRTRCASSITTWLSSPRAAKRRRACARPVTRASGEVKSTFCVPVAQALFDRLLFSRRTVAVVGQFLREALVRKPLMKLALLVKGQRNGRDHDDCYPCTGE